jgi:uncharacterized cupin superfamily protein
MLYLPVEVSLPGHMGDDNIWTDTWDEGEDWSGGGARAKRLPRGDELGATVYELGPGNWLPFHFHHGSEEYLVVLRGRPTLRTGDGSRELAEGDAVHFPRGPDGAHGLVNETDEPVRVLMASTLVSPEVAEYPDHKQITAQAHGLADRRSALADPRYRTARLLTVTRRRTSSPRTILEISDCSERRAHARHADHGPPRVPQVPRRGVSPS